MNKISLIILISLLFFGEIVFSQNVYIDANTLIPKTSLILSPPSGTFTEESVFDVTIILNTKGKSINGVDVKVNFDPSILSVVKPSGGKSIIGVWVEPPSFDNNKGVVSYVGVIPNGITTDSGVIGTISFKVKKIGKTSVKINSNSLIYLNDGLGTKTYVDFGIGQYDFLSKAPEGVRVYSETHPIQSNWYSNNSPVFSWEKDIGVTGFSFILDDKPNTIPDNEIDSSDTTKSYTDLSDGLNYFHIKSYKKGVWGGTGHFLVRIDTNPPADFKPSVNYVISGENSTPRALVSFFTTDTLSGIDRYEVGIVDDKIGASPVFVQSESPFQINLGGKQKSIVIVRSFDLAGNIKDVSVSVQKPFFLTSFIKEYLVYILALIILIGLLILIFHYLFGHKILSHLRRAMKIVEEEDNKGLVNIPEEKFNLVIKNENEKDNS